MSGGVFISYRRDDTAGFAGRIYDRLTNALGRESVFIDVDNIPAGLDFVDVLSERVGRCDALVAIIGRNWLASADKTNLRRLDDLTDFVRIEIEAALDRNVPVIPVLVDGAVMPQAYDLPDGLKKLARRQGIEISHTRFDADAERLTDALARIEGKTPADADARLPAPVPKPRAAARGGGRIETLPRCKRDKHAMGAESCPSNRACRSLAEFYVRKFTHCKGSGCMQDCLQNFSQQEARHPPSAFAGTLSAR